MEKSPKPADDAQNNPKKSPKKAIAKISSVHLPVKEAPGHKIEEVNPLMECYNG